MPDTIHILHTNDFHAKLTNAGAARLRQAVADLDGAPHLLLDAGDAVKAGNVEVSLFGEPTLRTMSELGYDAMTMGNREFHVLHPLLQAKIKDATFPILCANIRNKGDNGTLPVVPYITREIEGVRVAVFGLTLPMVTERMAARHLSHFLFDDPIETARRLAAELRPSHDVLIALTHIGIKKDERLAAALPDLDLIIGGHTHVILESPIVVNGVPIVEAGSFARFYGHLVLTRRPSGLWDMAGKLFPLQKGVA